MLGPLPRPPPDDRHANPSPSSSERTRSQSSLAPRTNTTRYVPSPAHRLAHRLGVSRTQGHSPATQSRAKRWNTIESNTAGYQVTTSFHLMNQPAPPAYWPLASPRLGGQSDRPVPRQFLRIKEFLAFPGVKVTPPTTQRFVSGGPGTACSRCSLGGIPRARRILICQAFGLDLEHMPLQLPRIRRHAPAEREGLVDFFAMISRESATKPAMSS